MPSDMGTSKGGGHDSADYKGPTPQGGPPTEAGTLATPMKDNAGSHFETHPGYPGTKSGAH